MKPVKIRSGLDRLRYALVFEAILIVLMGIAFWAFSDRSFAESGTLAAILSVVALIVALLYNYVLDRVDAHFGRVPTERTTLARIGHAVGFEFLLVVLTLPVIMWWMEWGFWQALMFDIVSIAFVVVYTYLFTLAYDRIYPVVQEPDEPGAAEGTA